MADVAAWREMDKQERQVPEPLAALIAAADQAGYKVINWQLDQIQPSVETGTRQGCIVKVPYGPVQTTVSLQIVPKQKPKPVQRARPYYLQRSVYTARPRRKYTPNYPDIAYDDNW